MNATHSASHVLAQRSLSLAIVIAFHALIGAGLLTLAHPTVKKMLADPVRIELIAPPAAQTAAAETQPRPEVRTSRQEQAREPTRRTVPTARKASTPPSATPILPSPATSATEMPPGNTSVATIPTAWPASAQEEAASHNRTLAEPSSPPVAEPIQAPRFDADYLHNPAPNYPRISRDLAEQGRVLLRVQVDPDGRPLQVLLDTSSGHSRLDRAARDAVLQWRFIPARQGRQTLAGWVKVPIVFELNN